ncbi:MAG: hypothetical protein AB7I38_10965 [Dehalococcoidia bacterium]
MTENTLDGLRVQQWGVEGVRAAGVLTVAVQPTAGDSFVIGDETYTFVSSGANEQGEINVGADLAAAKVNIVAAINGTDGWNAANPKASAATFSSDNCTITARIPGPAGNAIVFTENFTSGSNVMNGSGVLGGTTTGAFARGTAVAATSKIAIESITWGDDDESIYRPQFKTGLLIRNRGAAMAVQHGTRFSFSDQPVVWEQLMHWLTMVIEGEPDVVWDDGDSVYRWTFVRDPASNPKPLSWTLQRRFSTGLGSVEGTDKIDQRAAYALMSELELAWAQNEHMRMSGSGFARKFATSAITSALSLPTAQLGVSALSTVYMDDTWATVGDTLLAEQVVGWRWRIGTGAMPLHTAEGRTDLDFTKHQYDAMEVQLGLTITLLLDPATYAAESVHAAAGDLRAVRLNVAGSGGRLLQLDGLFQHTKPSLFKIGEQDGQDIVEIELEESTDQTNFLQAVIDHPTVYSLA